MSTTPSGRTGPAPRSARQARRRSTAWLPWWLFLGACSGGDAGDPGIPWAALAPLAVLALAFVVYCWIDIARNEVRHLPKWAWAVICLVSIPVGGVAYLLIGRNQSAGRS